MFSFDVLREIIKEKKEEEESRCCSSFFLLSLTTKMSETIYIPRGRRKEKRRAKIFLASP